MPKGNPGQTKEFLPNYSYFIGEKYKGLAPPNIILHTSNPVGAQRMRHILDSYGLKSEYQPGKPVNR
jgi:hypothetical protein